jgi:hypothetical protein
MSNQDRNIKTVLGIYQNKESFNKDTFVRLELSSKTNLVKPDKNIFVLNNIDQFNLERNGSNCYRINGKLEFITSNTLTGGWNDIPEDSDWDPKVLDEDFIGMNWILQLTYPATTDPDKEITSKTLTGTKISTANEGVQLDSITSINITGRREQILLKTVQRHGVGNIGEYVYIRPDGLNGLEYLGFHRVIDFEVGNEEYGLVLDTPFTTATFDGVVKRVFEPSLEDVNFINTTNVEQIKPTNEDGTLFAPNLGYTKIFSDSHGLRLGDFVDVRFNQFSELNGLYKIEAIPDLDSFVVKHNLSVTSSNTIDISSLGVGVTLEYRSVGGTPSEYYFRKFEIMTDLKDYEVYSAAYSKDLFIDGVSNNVDQFHFNKDIDVSNYRDNLGRPLSEIYLTVTKRASNGDGTNYNGYRLWGSVSSILEESSTTLPFDSSGPYVFETMSWWQSTPENVSGLISYPNPETRIYGDFVEYNRSQLTEKVLSHIAHRFAPSRVIPGTSNFDGGVGEGYYYLPHNKIQIREFSDIIETVPNKSDEIFPDYVQINNNGTVSWRDLLDIGFFEVGNKGVDHPFVNGCNYIYNNYAIYIRRQRPADPIDVSIEDTTTFVEIDPNSSSKC